MRICTLFSHSELSRTSHDTIAHTMDISYHGGNDVLIMWNHGVHVLEWLLHLEIWACHGQTQQLHFTLQPDWTMSPPLTRLQKYVFV
jgi:hypothetical protein